MSEISTVELHLWTRFVDRSDVFLPGGESLEGGKTHKLLRLITPVLALVAAFPLLLAAGLPDVEIESPSADGRGPAAPTLERTEADSCLALPPARDTADPAGNEEVRQARPNHGREYRLLTDPVCAFAARPEIARALGGLLPAGRVAVLPSDHDRILLELRRGHVEFGLTTRPLTHRDRLRGLVGEHVGYLALVALTPAESARYSIKRVEILALWRGEGAGRGPRRLDRILVPTPDGPYGVFLRRVVFAGLTQGTGAGFYADLEGALAETRVGTLLLVPYIGCTRKAAEWRVLPVDGWAPSNAAIVSGSYPLRAEIRLVHRKDSGPEVARAAALLAAGAGRVLARGLRPLKN